jgi:two-component system, sensor histidine kinase PdtaS
VVKAKNEFCNMKREVRNHLHQSIKTVYKNICVQNFLLVTVFILFHIGLNGQINLQNRLQSTQDSIQKYIYKAPAIGMMYARTYDSIASTQDSLKYKAKAKNFLGMMHYVKGNIESAIENYIESQRIFEILGEAWFVAMLDNNIGAAYQVRNDPESTIRFYEKALQGFTVLKDTLWMANIINNISVQKGESGNYAEELEYKKRALKIYEAQGDTAMILLTTGNMVHTYFKLKNYGQAEKCATEFLSSKYAEEEQALQASVLIAYAYLLMAQERWMESYNQAKKALTVSQDLGLTEFIIKAHRHLSDLYEQKKDFKNAYYHFQHFYKLQDSTFNEQKDKTINELLVQYDTEKKDNEINLLQSQNELKDLRLSQVSAQKWIMALGMTVLAILAFFSYRLQKIKTEANKKLEEKNKIILVALDEKNILLREIHHRVKNNLQVISSLLKLQSQYIEDENAIRAIAEGRNRVHSMAILHQNLYKEDNLTGVDMQEYFTGLIEGLFDAYNINSDQVHLRTDIQKMKLDIDTVIPLGLIANELVSNALKHAFADIQRAILEVRLWEENDRLFFEVRDNGVGYDPVDTAENKKSFGQRLIKSLSDKLEAEIQIKNDSGTDVVLKIKDYKKAS